MPLGLPPPLLAATNSALGGIGGINNGTLLGGDGTETATITLHSVSLDLVKQARDTRGTVLSAGSNVAPGQEIYFVLYVDNPTPYTAHKVELSDLLDREQFTYVPNSLEYTIVPSGSSDERLWAGPWNPLTDEVGDPDDIASFTESADNEDAGWMTVGAVSGQANQATEVPGQTRLAIRFKVRVK